MNAQDLKNSILQLAVQGKLVEQRAEEGTARELLEQIKLEKDQLIKDGKIPKERNLPVISEEEKEFELPSNWKYVRVQDVATYITDYVANGSFATLKKNTKTYKEKNYAIFVRTMDLTADFKTACSYIDKASYDFLEKSRLYGGELILPNIGGSIGKAFIMPNLGMPMSLAPNSIMIKFTDPIMNKFFAYLIQSPYGYKFLADTKGGTATPKFSKTELRNMVIMLPPFKEIERIVAKIEEILPYIDQYDKAYTKLETFNKKFPEDMKKSILQMAMQGKLVEQRAEEGTADELYEQIVAEKAQLIKDGKIKKEKPLPEIAEDEIPFEIPSSWRWVRFSEVMDVRDGTHDSPKYIETGIPLVTSKNISGGGLDFSNVKYISREDADKINERSNVDTGDILFAMIGSIGNPVIVNKDREFCVKNVALFKNYDKSKMCIEYVYWFLYREQYIMKKVASGGVQSFISLKVFRNYLFPLPPLEEQKRIVAKIEELLPYCDQLIK
mgnify:CR=1 FL=1